MEELIMNELKNKDLSKVTGGGPKENVVKVIYYQVKRSDETIDSIVQYHESINIKTTKALIMKYNFENIKDVNVLNIYLANLKMYCPSLQIPVLGD